MAEWMLRSGLPPKPDPRLDSYPLMESWTPTALVSLIYVVGVYIWRAEIIKRKSKQAQTMKTVEKSATKSNAWDVLKIIMVIYNVLMVFYSTVVTLGMYYAAKKMNYGLGCETVPDPLDHRSNYLVFFGYLFYVSKFVEMLDTVFFLWRGKVDQVTFLHVFHHASMPPSVWWGLKYTPGGLIYFFPLANSFIHILMYTYYGLAAAGIYQCLWWKNYLTLSQMIQFLLLILHQGQVFVPFNSRCSYPRIIPAMVVFYSTLFFILFANFYIKAYLYKQRLAKSTTASAGKQKKLK